MVEWHHLTGFQRDLLTAIAHLAAEDEQSYGLGIKRRVEGFREEQINHGRLYPNLDQLVNAGLVEKTVIDKRTNGYTLTETGRRAIERASDRLRRVTDEGGDER
jgi:DNA-binding PadR family transcriptional regulator